MNLDDLTSEYARELEQVATENSTSAYAIGQWLAELDERIAIFNKRRQKGDPRLTSGDIYKKATLKGLSRIPLHKQKRFFILFRDADENSPKRTVTPTIARALVDALHVNGTAKWNKHFTDADFPYPRSRILEIASKATSFRAIPLMLEYQLNDKPVFSKEPEIERFLEKNHDQFEAKFELEDYIAKPATGHALGIVDHMWTKVDKRGCQALILVELKVVVRYPDIGQVLGYRNEVRDSLHNEQARIYASKKHLSRNEAKTVRCDASDPVQTWLVGHLFSDSAYYAAKGQPIQLFRLRDKASIESLIGPLDARTMNRQQWDQFVGIANVVPTSTLTQADRNGSTEIGDL